MLFYSALHYVEAFLMTKSAMYRDHSMRQAEMRKWPETRAIDAVYNRLKKAGHEARYDGTLFRPGDVPALEQHHHTVRDAMLRALNPGAVSAAPPS